MKIAQVCPLIYASPPKLSGGTERVVHDLTEALVARGHAVTLFAADGSETSGELVSCGPPVASVTGHPPGYPGAREAHLMERIRQRKDEFDIIHCHTEFMFAPVLADVRDRVLATVHWRVDELDRQFFFETFPDLAVVAISDAQAAGLPKTAFCAGRVHHGLDTERYELGSGAGGYVAYLGRMTDQKGPDRAIRAARAAGLPIKLAGDIDAGNPDYFARKVKPLLGEDAEYIGPIGDEEKSAFLGQAAVFAMPIDWPEPFGLVVVEAMACGTPIAATPCGSMGELINGDSGVIAPEDAFSDALLSAARLDRGGVRKSFEQRFSRAHMGAAYEKIYLDLIGRAARAR